MATQIPLAEYLETSYRPDRDYVDGEVLERNLGETPHSMVQAFLGFYFIKKRDAWRVTPLAGQRVRTAPTRIRICDVCVVFVDALDGLIVSTPPVLCIEILSREDRMTETQERIDDYLGMGVRAVWVIDPWRKKAFQAAADGSLLVEPGMLRVEGSPIELPVAEVFEELGRIRVE
jgi:Uma2 family endonuclease